MVAATKAKTPEIINKINCLRGMPRTELDAGLAQIEFQVRGLRHADPAGEVGVRGIVAALRSNIHELDAAAERIFSEFPDDWQELLNLLRSNTMLGRREQVRDIVERLKAMQNVGYLDLHIVNAYFTVGLFDEIFEMESGIDYSSYSERECELIRSEISIARKISEQGGTGLDFSDLILQGQKLISEMGWPFPWDIQTELDQEGIDNSPVVLITYSIHADADQVLKAEEELLPHLYNSGNALMKDGLAMVEIGFAA